jgi:ATP-dependent Lhr-like helicase
VPRWGGGRMALTSTLGDAMLEQLDLAAQGRWESPEMRSLQPLLELQQKWSALPTPQHLLAETLRTREGWHLFVYPFAGRSVHLGLANLLAWRMAQQAPRTFSLAFNDYGFELLCAEEVDWAALLPTALHAAPHDGAVDEAQSLLGEVLASLNASELTRRRFREIARVSGLIFQSYPGERRSSRQMQASSSLFYEVFRKYDAGNLLLDQAQGELLAQELEVGRLHESLQRMRAMQLRLVALERPTPFAFPLMVELFREQLSNERLADRIARMVAQLEQAAGGATQAGDAEAVKATLVFGADPANSRR